MKNKAHQTMRAIAIDEFGGIEKMKPREMPVPEVAADEILIRVDSAGVGVWDPFEREGGFAKEFGVQPHFPYVPGWDGAGTVEDVGDDVHDLKRGDRVYGINFLGPKGGFYAEYTAVKANNAAMIPQALSTRDAGVLAVDGVIQGLQVGGGVIETINQVCTPNCGSHSLGTGLFTASGKPLAKLAPAPVVLAGNIAAVLNTAAGQISLYNAFTGTQLASVAVANANNVSLVGGDTQWLVFHIGRAISALNVNTHQIVPLTRTAPNPLDVSLSGHRVAWAENIHGHGRIRALELPN